MRRSHFIAVVGVLLIAGVVVGCGSGPENNIDDERGGQRNAAATNEETTAPEGDRPKAQSEQEEPVGLDAEVVSPLGQANLPEGFGEGSLWATDLGGGCDDVIGDSASASASASSEASCGGGARPKTLLKRVDPQTGEVVAAIPLEGSWGAPGLTEVAAGAGSVWVSQGEFSDPKTARIPGATLNDHLVGVVRETMHPSHASLWLRPDTSPEGEKAE